MRLFALILLVAALLAAGADRVAAQPEVSLDPSQSSSRQAAQEPSQQISQQASEETSLQFSQQFSEEASQPFLEPQAGANAPDKSKIVYVSDFELMPWTLTENCEKAFPRSRHRHCESILDKSQVQSSELAGWSISCPTPW